METHVRVLGVIFIVQGSFGVLAALGMLLLFGGLAGLAGSQSSEAAQTAPILGGLGLFLFIAIAVFSMPALFTGMGLLRFREWARILGIVLAALSLPGFPLFTVFGIYGLWTLLNQKTIPLFKGVPSAAPPPVQTV